MQKDAILWEKVDNGKIHCYLCSHNCVIDDDRYGICGMRQNTGGKLYTYAYGNVIAAHVDPIEKKPLYHFLPGTSAYSIATIGCNFKCPFCQNWTISQLTAETTDARGRDLSPEEIVREAERNNCASIAYTYTEPTVFFEYALDTAKKAKERGLHNSFVTNGYMTKDALDEISPYLDAANVDLKFFRDSSYKQICKARLDPVKENIAYMKEQGIWIEVTTLILPGKNDSFEELSDIATFLAGLDKNIPWHISRFHPNYQYTDSKPTPSDTIKRAMDIGIEAGLKYIYPGNVHLRGDTVCPSCGIDLIERAGFYADITDNFLESGECRSCGTKIAGVWA